MIYTTGLLDPNSHEVYDVLHSDIHSSAIEQDIHLLDYHL